MDKSHIKRIVRLVSNWFDNIDWFNVRFIPEGAYDPLPPIPNDIEITPKDIDGAIAFFDELYPELAGMLRADVKGKKDYG